MRKAYCAVMGLLSLAAATAIFVTTTAKAADTAKHMVEVIDLMPGKTGDDVLEYLRRIGPAAAEYGASNTEIYVMPKQGGKSGELQTVLLWRMENLQQLPQIFQDEDYTHHVAYRDSVMTIQNRSQYVGARVK